MIAPVARRSSGCHRRRRHAQPARRRAATRRGAGRRTGAPAAPIAGLVRTPAPSNVVVVEPEARRSRARSSTRRPATSGSRPAQGRPPAHGRAARTRCRRGRPTGRRSTSSARSTRRDVAVAGRARRLPTDRPEPHARHADGSGQPQRSSTASSRRAASTWFVWIRQPVVSPDGKTVALVSDAPDPTKSDVVLQFYDLATKKLDASPTSPRSRRSATRTRPGGRTARRCCTSATPATARRGAAAIYRYDLEDQEVRAADRPRLPRAVVLAGRALHRRDQDAARSAPTSSSSTRRADASSCASPTTARRGRRSGRPAATRSRSSTSTGQIVDLRMAVLDGTAPDWTVTETKALTEVSGLDGASRPDWFIPAEQLPAPTPGADHRRRPRARPPARARPPSDRHLPRAPGARDRPRPGPSSASASTRTRRRCPTASRATSPASSGSRRSSSRRRRRTPRRSSRTSRSSRRSGRPGSPPSSGSGPPSRPTCRSSPTRSAATSARRRPARPSRCSTASAPMRSPSTRTSAPRRSPRSSSAPTGSPTSCAGPPTPAPASCRTCVVAADADDRRPGRAAPPRGSPGGRRPGDPAGRSGLVVGATAPAELAAIRVDRARAWRSSSPASAPRAATSEPVLEHGRGERGPGRRASRRRAAGQRVAGDRERRRRRPATGVRRPLERRRGGRRRMGSTPPCATLARARTVPAPRPERRGARSKRSSQEHDDAEHRSPRAHHHPGHRAADPRPGQAARGRRRRSARASASSARRRPTSRTAMSLDAAADPAPRRLPPRPRPPRSPPPPPPRHAPAVAAPSRSRPRPPPASRAAADATDAPRRCVS